MMTMMTVMTRPLIRIYADYDDNVCNDDNDSHPDSLDNR